MSEPVDVIYVEDEPTVRLMYRLNLEADGFVVREAGDGEEALALVAAQLPQVVLADIMMPRLDGVELARALHDRYGAACPPIVFLSANPADLDEQIFSELADDFLHKPFPPALLGPRLRDVLLKRHSVRP